jgi:hypothetical protein
MAWLFVLSFNAIITLKVIRRNSRLSLRMGRAARAEKFYRSSFEQKTTNTLFSGLLLGFARVYQQPKTVSSSVSFLTLSLLSRSGASPHRFLPRTFIDQMGGPEPISQCVFKLTEIGLHVKGTLLAKEPTTFS